jgi:FMN phosphatase YigB (HAD superfamily)
MSAFFHSITISSEAGFAKPDPRIFVAASESLGYPPHRVVIVGDSLVDDYQGGERAGLHAILLDRTNRYAAIRSIRRILTLRELPPLFANG